MIKIAFCDWWIDEYGGGEFDEYNNYFTNLLKEHYKNYIIQPVGHDKIQIYCFIVFWKYSFKIY